MVNSNGTQPKIPSRAELPGAISLGASLVAAWLIGSAIHGAGVSVGDLVRGVPEMGRIVSEMFPPATDRLAAVGKSLLETFQMALAGTVIGVILSLPLAVLATRSQSPHIIFYYLSRTLISFFRTVPDLIWALLFVVSVGLGPFAGTLTLVIDTIGFCGRFFAEGMEEVDKGPEEALKALGATRLGIIHCAILPAALPSLINSSLFALEKAIRSSVVLGLVRAGGIGIELKVAMDMFRFAEAATIILCVFALVFFVEQISSRIRRRVMNGG